MADKEEFTVHEIVENMHPNHSRVKYNTNPKSITNEPILIHQR